MLRVILAEIGHQCAEAVVDSLPWSEAEARLWLAGVVWGLLLSLLLLIAVSWLTMRQLGQAV